MKVSMFVLQNTWDLAENQRQLVSLLEACCRNLFYLDHDLPGYVNVLSNLWFERHAVEHYRFSYAAISKSLKSGIFIRESIQNNKIEE